MEGGVDFYCPRGWAWAENCKFITHSGPAAIWHDGSANPDSKTVLKNCSFYGFDGFKWGTRVYYYNCHRKGGDYSWHANNLSSAPGNPDGSKINTGWVFGNRWQLEANKGL